MFRLALAVFALITSVSAQTVTPLPVVIPASEPLIRLTGRADFRSADGPRFAFSGTTISATFSGTSLNADLSGGQNQFEILIDGVKTGVLALTEGRKIYRVADGLAAGNHTIQLFQRTEPLFGTAQFFGFQLEADQKLAPLPERPERRIEFIGDSITCGYGNEAKSEKEHFSPLTENHYLTYAALTTRALQAESSTVAWTGGVLSKTNPGNRAVLPTIYPRALPDRAKSLWDFTKWIPQVVVINLGTNDFGGKIPEIADWNQQYRAFLAVIRQNYPEAHFFLCSGPMLGGESMAALRKVIREIALAENEAGFKNVHVVEFPGQKYEDGLGADFHPSLKTHEKMSALLIAAIKKEMAW